MNSYILLRDNKETGPHSLADLQQLGLKPHDLIWVECQSVSWRNPGEITELKKLLEGIPEKTQPVQATARVEESQPVTIEELPAKEEAVDETISAPQKKSVFVALPVNKSPVAKTEQKYSTVIPDSSGTDKYKPVPVENAGIIEEKTEKTVETKYVRSLDEIKEMYVKNIEQRKVRPRSFSIKLPKQAQKAAVYIGLVLVGAVTVLLFRNSDGKVPSIGDQQSPLVTKIKTRPDTTASVIAENSISNDPVPEPENPASNEMQASTRDEEPIRNEKKELIRENPVRMDEGNSRRDLKSETEDQVQVPADDKPEIKKIPVDALASQVSVKTNTYTIAALGGIRNLELTLQNDSKYHLDKVTVEIRYLNPAGIILKTEDIHFKSVDPNAAQTIPVKKTNRGVKVSYKITRIESKAIGGSTAGL